MGRKGNNSRRITGAAVQAEHLDAMRPTLEHRARSLGVEEIDDKVLQRMRSTVFSDSTGRIVHALAKTPEHAEGLWGAVEHYRSVHARYMRAIDAPSPHPKGASITSAALLEEKSEHAPAPRHEPLDEEEEYLRARRTYSQLVNDLGPYANLVRSVLTEDAICHHEQALIEGLEIIRRFLKNEQKKRAKK